MSALPTLDVARFAKIKALHDGTDVPGERDAAAGRMLVLAAAAGLTLSDAITASDTPSPLEAWFDSTHAGLFEDLIAERERERSERWRQVVAEYGSERAVFTACAWEQALQKACSPFQVTRLTTGWPLGSLWGWHRGSGGDPAPPIIAAVEAAYSMPRTVRQAWAEFSFWEKLSRDREARGVGMGDPTPGVAIRVQLLERLLSTLPARSLGDMRARLSWAEYQIDQDIGDRRATLSALRADVERMAARIPRTTEGAE